MNATRTVPIIRVYQDGRREERTDELVEEAGVVFRRGDGAAEMVVPASPVEPERLAAGVLFRHYRLRPAHGHVHAEDGRIVVTVEDTAEPVACIRDPLASTGQEISPAAPFSRPTAKELFQAADTLEEISELRSRTGGVHVAMYVSAQSRILAEDVSRHSAVDRLIGSFVLAPGGRPVPGFVILSCRITVDIVERFAAVNVTTIASVSAPTAGAVDIACKRGIALFGFIRHGRMNVYGRVTTRRSTAGTGTHGPGEREPLQSP